MTVLESGWAKIWCLELGFFWMELKTRDTIVQHVILDDLNEQADMIWKLELVELGSTLARVQYILKKGAWNLVDEWNKGWILKSGLGWQLVTRLPSTWFWLIWASRFPWSGNSYRLILVMSGIRLARTGHILETGHSGNGIWHGVDLDGSADQAFQRMILGERVGLIWKR